MALLIGSFVCGSALLQMQWSMLGRPRAAIVRVQGTETRSFARRALRTSFTLAMLFIFIGGRGLAWWLSQPALLPIEPHLMPPGGFTTARMFTDVWAGLACRGHAPQPHDPAVWSVAYVRDCPAGLFALDVRGTTHENATMPSFLRGKVLAMYSGWACVCQSLCWLVGILQTAKGWAPQHTNTHTQGGLVYFMTMSLLSCLMLMQ